MLKENIKAIRKAKGLSQGELAKKLNVVRQTISKWELGLSVPDADMLLALSKVLETPVSTLLGETITEAKNDDLKSIAESLEAIKTRLAHRKATIRKVLHWCFISLCADTAVMFVLLAALKSFYLGCDYSNPEAAVVGVGLHSFEWLFVRIAPFVLIGGIAGAIMTRKKK